MAYSPPVGESHSRRYGEPIPRLARALSLPLSKEPVPTLETRQFMVRSCWWMFAPDFFLGERQPLANRGLGHPKSGNAQPMFDEGMTPALLGAPASVARNKPSLASKAVGGRLLLLASTCGIQHGHCHCHGLGYRNRVVVVIAMAIPHCHPTVMARATVVLQAHPPCPWSLS